MLEADKFKLIAAAKRDKVAEFSRAFSDYQELSVDRWVLLREACLNGASNVVDFYIRNLDDIQFKDGNILDDASKAKMLCFAIRGESTKCVESLLALSVDITHDSYDVLKWSLRTNQLEIAQKLIEYGKSSVPDFDINFENGLLLNYCAASPQLFIIGEKSGTEFVAALFDNGADPRKSEAVRISSETGNTYAWKLMVAATALLEFNHSLAGTRQLSRNAQFFEAYLSGDVVTEDKLNEFLTPTKRKLVL